MKTSKVIFDHFVQNGDAKLEDLIYNIQIGEHEGSYHVNFETRDKYVHVETGTSDEGQYISFTPYIYCEERGIYLEDIEISKYDEYLNHPDWYSIQIIIPIDGRVDNAKVTPLKYQYHVAFMPDVMAFNMDCLKPAEIENEMTEVDAVHDIRGNN